MEQQEPRKLFINNLNEFCKQIVLNETFMEELKKHLNWEYVKEAMKFEDEMARKVFIFLEFTRDRSTCNEMVEILRKSDQEDAAAQLQKFNTSPPFMDITHDIELKVTPASVLRSGGSKIFVMDQKPRGICIIINNVTNQLYKESLRFKNIFEQLCFDVEECYDMSAKAMEDRLRVLAKDERLKKDQALVIMIISHGHDEQVIGIDGEDLRISAIVDIFSEINCQALKRKPKLFFFNCCQTKSQKHKVVAKIRLSELLRDSAIETIGQNWINKNKYTLICFSCSKAERSWVESNSFTLFGQALSHCIAQYACDKSVQSIMNLTYERTEQLLNDCQEDCEIQLSPEIRCIKMTRELFLNPGLPINRNDKDHENLKSLELTLFNKKDLIKPGAFGEVFRYTDEVDNKLYAVKKIPMKDISSEDKAMLFREIKIMSQLSKVKNSALYVVKYYKDWFSKNGSYFIQMELCYCDLGKIIEIKPKEFNRKTTEPMNKIEFYITCELFEEILECVDYLHEQNLIHRDLQPENIFITDKGINGRFVKIGDFGLAVYHELKSKAKEHTTDAGTFEYMAPEVMSGRKYGQSADIYSLGVILSKIFDFDIYNDEIANSTSLSKNYQGIRKLCKTLMDIRVVMRPNCKTTKNNMKEWAIYLDDLIIDEVFNKLRSTITNDITIEESFHKFFIKIKLEYFKILAI